MAAGYNLGMKSSDAKYKVYIHQDVFIKYTGFIVDLLKVFASDRRIGLAGMIGITDLGTSISTLTNWNVGKISDSLRQWNCSLPLKEEVFREVQAADGLLLATQYDIPWREDVFDGWDFYDISQAMEFRNAGYKVVVPWQEEAWCYHNSTHGALTKYYDYGMRFAFEYGGILSEAWIQDLSVYARGKKRQSEVETLLRSVEELFSVCGEESKATLREVFQNEAVRECEWLKEYETIIYIDETEEREKSEICFWKEGMSLSQLVSRFRKLKRALKRIEYGFYDSDIALILSEYSEYAITEVCNRCIADRRRVFQRLNTLYGI